MRSVSPTTVTIRSPRLKLPPPVDRGMARAEKLVEKKEMFADLYSTFGSTLARLGPTSYRLVEIHRARWF